jgi:hypothetical protein
VLDSPLLYSGRQRRLRVTVFARPSGHSELRSIYLCSSLILLYPAIKFSHNRGLLQQGGEIWPLFETHLTPIPFSVSKCWICTLVNIPPVVCPKSFILSAWSSWSAATYLPDKRSGKHLLRATVFARPSGHSELRSIYLCSSLILLYPAIKFSHNRGLLQQGGEIWPPFETHLTPIPFSVSKCWICTLVNISPVVCPKSFILSAWSSWSTATYLPDKRSGKHLFLREILKVQEKNWWSFLYRAWWQLAQHKFWFWR